jgi:predicted HTH transcriptional regulator
MQTEKKSPPAQIKEEKKEPAKPFPVSKPELPPAEKAPSLPREIPPPPAMEYNINPRQKDLLERLKSIKKITRKEYAEMFNVSIPTAARDLKELMDKQLLKAEGPLGPGRWYEPV